MDKWKRGMEILLISLHFGNVYSTQMLYATEGSVFEIICPLKASLSSISWIGPPNSSIYAVGSEVAPNIPSIAINQCSSCSNSVLVIRNMTQNKTGQYECYDDKNTKSGFEVSLKRNPSELRIINETTDKQVIGVEGNVMILECAVKKGQPEGNITWTVDGNVLAVNISEHVYLKLTPKRSDNGRTAQCTAYSGDGIAVENRQIKLLIYYRPNVTIYTTPSNVIPEGQKLKIECLHNGNDPNSRIKWIRNEMEVKENESTLYEGNVSRENAGKYTCCVATRAGTIEATVIIVVHYPPDVIVKKQHLRNIRYQLKCTAYGIPSNYVFYKWEHMTDRNEHIRFVSGSPNGELTISYGNHDWEYYQNSGIYLCNVSNMVPNSNGSIFQTGITSLKIEEKPFFLTINKLVQYGMYGREGKIRFFVHSYPKYESINLSCKNITLRMKTGDVTGRYTFNETVVIVQDMIFDSLVKVNAYRIDIRIQCLQESDFTTMTIFAGNSKGNAAFTFQLKSADGPDPPFNVSVKAHMNSILLYWDRGFDGGYLQTFVIEFKEHKFLASDEWNIYGEINDTMKETYSVTIEGLKFDRLYALRIYSYNLMNKSHIIYTDLIRTLSEPSNVVYDLIWLIVSIVATLIVVLLIRTYRGKIHDVLGKSCRFSQNSLSSLNGGERSNDISPAVNLVAASNQLYSSIDRQLGFQIDRQHGFQMVQNVSYAVSGARDETSRKQKGALNCTNYAEQNEIYTNEFHTSEDGPELNYVEVSFDPLPKHRQFFIHGEDERTPYADIDLSIKAEPLPESEPESSEE